MKRYYCVTVLALIVVAVLQGYNIYLQYGNYVRSETDKINSALKISVDEEYGKRAHKEYNLHKDGKQHFYHKDVTEEDVRKAKPKKEDVIRFNDINIQELREKGIAETEAEAMGLLTKDRLTAKGNPINLSALSQIFKKNLKEPLQYTLYILDENKRIVRSYGNLDGTGNWQLGKPIAIGLKPVRFVNVRVDVLPSSFVRNSVETLASTILLAFIIVFCVGYQMTVIRHKEDLLKNREVCIHGAIHDLKSPLASVLLALGFIEGKIHDETLKDLLTSAKNDIKSLADNIKNILITAKAGETQLVISKESINILELANHAKQQVDINYASKAHVICIHDDRTRKAEIFADRYLIENIILNLMENAVKYSEQEAIVDVNIYEKDSSVAVSVKDHGVGIKKKYQKRIFEQFYRIPSTHHKKGYGIGLALVKYAIKAHKGTIKVESELGKGSVFTFTLPIDKIY